MPNGEVGDERYLTREEVRKLLVYWHDTSDRVQILETFIHKGVVQFLGEVGARRFLENNREAYNNLVEDVIERIKDGRRRIPRHGVAFMTAVRNIAWSVTGKLDSELFDGIIREVVINEFTDIPDNENSMQWSQLNPLLDEWKKVISGIECDAELVENCMIVVRYLLVGGVGLSIKQIMGLLEVDKPAAERVIEILKQFGAERTSQQ